MARRGLSPVDLAAQARVSLSTVYAAMRGESHLKPRTIEAIAGALGVSQAYCTRLVSESGSK